MLRGVRISLPPLSERAVQRRTLDERLFVRSPALYRWVAHATTRLPPRSRLRRLMVAYSIQRGYAALTRRDFDAVLIRSDPEVEYRPNGDLIAPDLDPVYYGHDGYRRLWKRWFDAFDDFHWEPKEIIDFGDKLLVTAELKGQGRVAAWPLARQRFSSSSSDGACRSRRRTSPTATRPSKPPGCGSRRCRRRTWSPLAVPGTGPPFPAKRLRADGSRTSACMFVSPLVPPAAAR